MLKIYHQNPDDIRFIFRFDPFSYHHWERGILNIGGSAHNRALPKRGKVTPLVARSVNIFPYVSPTILPRIAQHGA